MEFARMAMGPAPAGRLGAGDGVTGSCGLVRTGGNLLLSHPPLAAHNSRPAASFAGFVRPSGRAKRPADFVKRVRLLRGRRKANCQTPGTDVKTGVRMQGQRPLGCPDASSPQA